MAADVQLGASARVGRPRELLPDDAYFVVPNGGGRQYHVAPDGRLLLIRALAASSTAANDAHLVVVENWLDELEQLVPAGR